jgi:hypothetical protein
MSCLIHGLYKDWIFLDERSGTIASDIEKMSEKEANCQRLMSVPGVGPLISTRIERLRRPENLIADHIKWTTDYPGRTPQDRRNY